MLTESPETMRSELLVECTIFSLNTPCTLRSVVSVCRRDVTNTISGIAVHSSISMVENGIQDSYKLYEIMPNLGSTVDVQTAILARFETNYAQCTEMVEKYTKRSIPRLITEFYYTAGKLPSLLLLLLFLI